FSEDFCFLNLIQDMRDASTWPLAHLASSEIVSVEGKQEEKAQTEDEIQALRQVLLAKEQYAADIRRQLGMSPLGNIKQSISKGWQEVQTSAPYVRTRDSLSHAGQVTSAAMSSVGVVITRRLAQMRYTHSQHSSTFRSFEEMVGNMKVNSRKVDKTVSSVLLVLNTVTCFIG
uniref:Tpd52 like 2a n=1 Tax=Pundamilia nyererei TaxID=303518 RepID=A0A3B4G9K1_9CICH